MSDDFLCPVTSAAESSRYSKKVALVYVSNNLQKDIHDRVHLIVEKLKMRIVILCFSEKRQSHTNLTKDFCIERRNVSAAEEEERRERKINIHPSKERHVSVPG